jgi:hypothetical protein
MRRTRFLIVSVVAILMLLPACTRLRELRGQFGDLMQLRANLQHQTGEDAVEVHLNNGTYLIVSLLNSSLAKLPTDRKQAKALEIAKYAYQDWPQRDALTKITVVFETKYDLGIVHYANAMDNYSFDPAKLKSAGIPADNGQQGKSM